MRILVAGDSLGLPRPHRINNYNPSEKELAVAYNETYSSIVNHELFQEFQGSPFIELINRSRRFQTIKGVCQEIWDFLFFYEVDVLVLQVGIVDCWFREELDGKQMVNKEEYKLYLEKILELLSLRPNCRLIMVGICPTSLKMEGRYPGINQMINDYNAILKEKADQKTSFYIDMEAHVKSDHPYQYLLPDDHHLNKEGNKLVAQKIKAIIRGLIYSDMGVELYNKEDQLEAIKHFSHSFSIYPEYIDNLYNLLVLSYQMQEKKLFEQVAQYVQENNLEQRKSQELQDIIKTLRTE
ncbi:hypothetical protein CD798_14810 [Bacillaceae bacterium SAOS 7]|nr:hypothetical protein CD798_14810 [Bacillaceae bacterium SAOS 7]